MKRTVEQLAKLGWVSGAEVSCRYGFGNEHWGPITQVDKVYKSGRVVIDGMQYTPGYDGLLASRSNGPWSSSIYYLLTPEVRGKRATDIKAQKNLGRQRAVAEWLIGQRDEFHQEAVEAIEALMQSKP